MTSQEARNELIARLVSKLLRTMTGIEDEKFLSRCEQLSWKILRKHRGFSIDKHDVRRKIESMKEKFLVDNLKEYADYLEELCNAVLCLKHDEVGFHWSLINFLLDIAYKPTVALRKNPNGIVIESGDPNSEDISTKLEEFEIKNLLKEDFIPATNYENDGSDLSDWSDDEDTKEIVVHANNSSSPRLNQYATSLEPLKLLPNLPALKPPAQVSPFRVLTAEPNIKDHIEEIVQNSWWIIETEHSLGKASAQNVAANFATILSSFVPKHLLKFNRFRDPILIDDFCFMRELIWMFYAPQSCKAFHVDAGEIKTRVNVTLTSVSAQTLVSFMENQILPYANQMNLLRNFLNSVNAFQSNRLPRTYDFYAANLKSLLDPITSKIVDFEDRIAAQRDFELNTLIVMHSFFRETFKEIETLYTIHKAVSLDYNKLPAHIISSYLLAALMQFTNNASKPSESNLSVSLFLTSIKAFCGIIDSWWNEGRLDDWQEEFAIECNSDQSISLRMYGKNKEKSFFVPKDISEMICENEFIRLLLAHSLEVGHTLNLLYEISRIGDLRNDCKAIESDIYDSFIEDVLRQARTLSVKTENVQIETQDDMVDSQQKEYPESHNVNVHLTTNDEFLLMLFDSNEQSLSANDTVDTIVVKEKTAFDIYGELSQYQQILPYEEIILKSFSKILRERIALANTFVVKLYREDFKIVTHLRNVRKVLLLEADDLMLQFYEKLFKQIEAGKPWANAFVLTMQLDDILSSKFPDMSSHFRFEVHSKKGSLTTKVTEAVNSFFINYNLSNELVKIINEDDMKIYNKIFRFLLQIKWGLMTLENLPFARANRPLYASIDMIQFAMRRLENIRFWMISAIQWIASHLLMLQVMGEELDTHLNQCKTVREMKAVHKSYLEAILQHCFLTDNLKGILIGVEQLLSLVIVLQSDHYACLKQLKQCSPLGLDDSGGLEYLENEDYSFTAHIDQVELTYIRCHEYLANMLKNEVYIKQNSFLSCLSAAFNTSMPY